MGLVKRQIKVRFDKLFFVFGKFHIGNMYVFDAIDYYNQRVLFKRQLDRDWKLVLWICHWWNGKGLNVGNSMSCDNLHWSSLFVASLSPYLLLLAKQGINLISYMLINEFMTKRL
mgnify:FL=1